jgi:hypothetical protein
MKRVSGEALGEEIESFRLFLIQLITGITNLKQELDDSSTYEIPCNKEGIHLANYLHANHERVIASAKPQDEDEDEAARMDAEVKRQAAILRLRMKQILAEEEESERIASEDERINQMSAPLRGLMKRAIKVPPKIKPKPKKAPSRSTGQEDVDALAARLRKQLKLFETDDEWA